MKTSPLFFAACALAPFMAASHAAPQFDPSGFELRETKALSISVKPITSLSTQSAPNASYRIVPEGITLSSEARQPTAYHARQPSTELSESHIWRVQDQPASFETTIRIDRFPKNGQPVLTELTPETDAAPLLRLALDGDRVVLTGQIENVSKNGIAVGTLDKTHEAHILVQTQPDGRVAVSVNGTESQLHLTRQALATPVVFRTGAHAINDIGTSPDTISVTLTGLTSRHGQNASSLRT